MNATGKVGLVGTGFVGASFAYSLMQQGTANELVLIDVDNARAEGEAMDLNHGLPFVGPMKIYAGDYSALAGAEVTVITAGLNQKPGETRLELLSKNAAIMRSIIPEVVKYNPDGLILIASNPVDIMTYIACETAGLRPGQVIGSGTILDTARFRYLLSEYYQVDPRSVHAYIIGEHGDSELAVWSLANIAGVRLRDFVGSNGRGYDQAAMDDILFQTRNAAYEIIRRKKATYYAIGLGLHTLVESILKDRHSVLTVSTPLHGQFGVEGMAISLPSIVSRSGMEEVLNIQLAKDEIEAFQRSAQTLKENYAKL
ncbi:L-lactate dehydrogenase [Chloroflexia bacterium SDU3-3]|nr:L-lactate dehydrogenase [Chloroflexia bacterium SDU3-3]